MTLTVDTCRHEWAIEGKVTCCSLLLELIACAPGGRLCGVYGGMSFTILQGILEPDACGRNMKPDHGSMLNISWDAAEYILVLCVMNPILLEWNHGRTMQRLSDVHWGTL